MQLHLGSLEESRARVTRYGNSALSRAKQDGEQSLESEKPRDFSIPIKFRNHADHPPQSSMIVGALHLRFPLHHTPFLLPILSLSPRYGAEADKVVSRF